MKYVISGHRQGAKRPYGYVNYDLQVEMPPEGSYPVHTKGHDVLSQVAGHIAYNIQRHIMYEWALKYVVPKNGIGLEIGVDYGDGIDLELSLASPKSIIGVDPWMSQEFDNWFDCAQSDMDERYAGVMKRFAEHENVAIIRDTSDNFFNNLEDGVYFDWVNIDGDHRHRSCFNDIENSYKRLVPGGIIIVDDTMNGKWHKDIIGAIKDALSIFTDLIPLNSLHESDPIVLKKVNRNTRVK